MDKRRSGPKCRKTDQQHRARDDQSGLPDPLETGPLRIAHSALIVMIVPNMTITELDEVVSLTDVHNAGSRKRSQPPPPNVVFDALADPAGDGVRPWLLLLNDEQRPQLIDAEKPTFLVWSSLWPKRPDAQVRFDLAPDGAAGTQLQWTLFVAEPPPDPSLLGHMRKRLNELINANLRSIFGQ